MPVPPRWQLLTLILGTALCMSGCGAATPLVPGNNSPVVQSLMVFPTTLGPGDSAIVVCTATDADGDVVVFDWFSDCRLSKKGESPYGGGGFYNQGNTLVVYAGTCASAPLDTGWLSCSVRDSRGGGANAGTVRIVISQ